MTKIFFLVRTASLSLAAALTLAAQTPATTAPSTAMAKSPAGFFGDWIGVLDVGAAKLKVAFHITGTPAAPQCTLDVPEQGATNIPCTSAKSEAGQLTLDLAAIGATYVAKLTEDHHLTGEFSQGGFHFPLLLTPGTLPARVRPQTPKPPFPYLSQEVMIPNPAAPGITLAGTLTLPSSGKGPFTAIVMVTGSGPQDRDETLFGHKPFFVMADRLTREGYAVLRYDDRGVAKSTGTFKTSTTLDFATDAEAAVAFLKTRPDINPQRIGILGHSEGALIAAVIASRQPTLGFAILLAGPGVPGGAILRDQFDHELTRGGVPEDIRRETLNARDQIYQLLKDEPDAAKRHAEILRLTPAAFGQVTVSDPIKERLAGELDSPWMRVFVTEDPAIYLAKTTQPLLYLLGELDHQVSPPLNLPPVKTALEKNKQAVIKTMPGLNHLFQEAKTGEVGEYKDIDQTTSPRALDAIAAWMKTLPK